DPAQAEVADLRAAVEKAGYGIDVEPAPLPAARAAEDEDPRERERAREVAELRTKSIVSLIIGLVMMAFMYLPLDIEMSTLAPSFLIAATFAQFWAGRTFYQAAWAAGRHGGTNMNTLVAVGTSVAYGYSVFVTLWPAAAARWGFEYHLYYES